MKKKLLIGFLIGAMALNVGCFNNNSNGNETESNVSDANEAESNVSNVNEAESNVSDTNLLQYSEIQEGERIAIIKTNMGDIKLRFFPEQAPKAVENFLTHAENGYYDGVIFHRVIEDFMIQGGDPLGVGTGGESIWGEAFEDEFSPELRHFYGALSMANAGVDANGSQFFIVQNSELDADSKEQFTYFIENQDQEFYEGVYIRDVFPADVCEKYIEVGGAYYLDDKHTVFGQVYEGMDIVNKIAAVKTDDSDKPLEDVIIESIEVTEYSK